MEDEASRTTAGLGQPFSRQGAWSVDLQRWRVHWSPQARAIHEVARADSLTVWEALEFVDAADRPRLLEAALRLVREGSGAVFRVQVGLTTARGRRKRVIVTGFRTGADSHDASIKGTISEHGVPAPGPVAAQAAAGAEGLDAAVHEWEVFAAALPHEMKEPLGVARGLAAAVRDLEGGLSATGASRLDRVVRRLAQLDELLEGLLALSPSARPPRRDPVNLSELAAEVLAALREAQPQRTVRCTVQPQLWVRGDERMLRIALANLLRNAWKFTEGQPAAQLGVRAERRGEVDVVCVEDNGIGFDMGSASRLFLPFERLHDAHPFEGSGLGLALARRIVERHGGSIWAESAPGAGARFLFTLSGGSAAATEPAPVAGDSP